MTKEQERAIKILEQYKQECIEEYKVELDDKKNIDEQHASYLHQQIEAVHTVLSMLKENSAEIEQKNTELAEKNAEIEKLKKEKEHWKNGFERELEDNRKNTCELLKQDLIIRKKDKMINLMTEFINKVWCDYPGSIFKKLKDDGFNTNECSNCVGKVCKDCVKQYFERQVNSSKQ